MKRILPILLILLLLTGCRAEEAPESVPPTDTAETAAAAKMVSLYDEDSQIEAQTGGAVRAYPLGDSAKTQLMRMGQQLLVVFDDGILTLLQGEKGEVAATGMANLHSDRTAGELICWDDGVMYFDRESREVVVLDGQLRENLTVRLPEEAQGNPVLQKDEIFYCADSEIRALDIHTGISRLVRQHSCVSQELTGSYFDDTVIGCRITDESGLERTVYLSAETGEVVQTDTAGFTMDTWEDRYFAVHTGEQTQYVFGALDAEPMCLYPLEETVVSVLPMNGAVGYTVGEEGLRFSFYNLTAEARTTKVVLPQMDAPQSVISDGSFIWFTAGGILYRWDVTVTAVADDGVYTELCYTRENPNTEGLALCQERAQKLRDTYGINLYLWQEAATLTKAYTQEEEYRFTVIQDSLDQIEALLQQFPEDFVRNTGDVSFYLVGSLKSGEHFAQYWNGAACNVVLDSQDVTKSFLLGLGVAIDTKVLGNSRDFDTWDSLNPKGFKYTYDYEENEQRETVNKYLDAFIDQRSMSFPTEDRSRIFAFAVLPEGAEYFKQSDLQKKLIRICEAIREAYDLEKSTEIFPWEQYLKDPIAKTE